MAASATERPGVGVRELQYGGAILATVVTGIHLLHPQLGAPRLITYLQVGTLFDPRPLAFTVSAFLIVFGMVLVYQGLFVRQVYLLGSVLMVTFILGYVAWHTVLDHGSFWPHIHAHSHHEMGILETMWVHLIGDPVAMVSKAHELALLVVLVVLYRTDSTPVN